MEKAPNASVTVLGANEGFSVVRKFRRLYRDACRDNPYTRWLPPKQLLTKEARSLRLPLSWNVELEGRGKISITPDAIIGFDVKGSTRRVLLVTVDYGHLPVESETGESLLLRTEALVAARRMSSKYEGTLSYQLRYGHYLIVWLMHNSQRLELLKRACADRGYHDVCLVEKETFLNADDALSVQWHLSNDVVHTLI